MFLVGLLNKITSHDIIHVFLEQHDAPATFWYGFFGVDIKTMACFVDDVVVIVQGAGGQFGKWIEWSPQPLGSRP